MSSSSSKKKPTTTASDDVGPAKKKAKATSTASQSNLSSFFPAKPSLSTTSKSMEEKQEQAQNDDDTKLETSAAVAAVPGSDAADLDAKGGEISINNNTAAAAAETEVPDPIVPTLVDTPPRHAVEWQSLHDNFILIRKVKKEEPRCKVAAFDLDGTLVVWSASFSGFWPNQLTHYELWSSSVPKKLRDLHDDGYKLLLISNQGGIQKAHTGKKATLVKNVVEFLAKLVDRPIHVVMSTKSLNKDPRHSFHKPTAKMWGVAQQYLNQNQTFHLQSSFFVGDSADPNDEQGGVDLKFAQAVSPHLKFFTPQQYWGPSDAERRKKLEALSGSLRTPPSTEALAARAALLGAYWNDKQQQLLHVPILLILCGVQGCGKSTFCEMLLRGKNSNWVHFSQDTIHNGKPGKREKVEEAARAALEQGKCVVVDRMHLDPEQRSYFLQSAQAAKVPAHAVLLNPPKHIIAQRVRDRTDHPGKVQGEDGAKRALQSLDKLVIPTYAEEGLKLISVATSDYQATRLAQLYSLVGTCAQELEPSSLLTMVPKQIPLSEGVNIPTISLGTMGLGKKVAKTVVMEAVAAGLHAVDTAPTYKNEDRVGDALAELDKKSDDNSNHTKLFCIAKIPKAVTEPDQVRPSLESTLEKLQRPHVDLLLLHWPCDVMAAGNLATIWKAMEDCLRDGKCRALGVCNFNPNALSQLLTHCSIPPAVNQVERHPLLSQMELVDFCAQNNIQLQAHTPLGQGKDALLAHRTIVEIANQRSSTPAQVVLRWNLQQGCLVVPKCSTKEHLEQIVAACDDKTMLLPTDMKALDALDQGTRFVAPPFMFGDKPYCWGPRAPPLRK